MPKDSSSLATDSIVAPWEKSFLFAVQFSQLSLHNWASGGQNNISTSGFFNGILNYKHAKNTWENLVDVGFGIVKQGKIGIIKSDDKIELNSKIGHQASPHWSYTGLFNFKSQFAKGYENPGDSVYISDWIAPAYFLTSIGMDYKPKEGLSAYIGPFTGKTTLVNHQAFANRGDYGVEEATTGEDGQIIEPGKKIRNEFGGYIRLQYRKEVAKKWQIQSKLDLFSNYLKNPENIDINWSGMMNIKFTRFFSVSLLLQAIYDDDVNIESDHNSDGIIDSRGPRLQFKEVFGLGFSLQF